MNKDTLTKKIIELEQEFESKKKEVLIEYCNENNPYNVGDKFTDHIGTILIERIRYSFSNSLSNPCCVYFGAVLKKDGTPKKSNDKRKAWQNNDKSKNTTT